MSLKLILSTGDLDINFKKMKRNSNKINQMICFLWIALICGSCQSGDCPLSSGSQTLESRTLAAFNQIILNDKINLILTQDSIQKISIGGGNHLLAKIETTVLDSVLTIKNSNGCNWLRDPDYQINVYVSSNRLQKISYYGAGDISSTNTMLANQFTVDSWYGTGSVKLSLSSKSASAFVRNNNAVIILSGHADSSFIYCGQEGSVNMVDFISGYVSVDSKSIEDIYVNVTGSLLADIVYKGNVYSRGSPAIIDTLITNSGRLIHIP
jgi:hypothetical protein